MLRLSFLAVQSSSWGAFLDPKPLTNIRMTMTHKVPLFEELLNQYQASSCEAGPTDQPPRIQIISQRACRSPRVSHRSPELSPVVRHRPGEVRPKRPNGWKLCKPNELNARLHLAILLCLSMHNAISMPVDARPRLWTLTPPFILTTWHFRCPGAV